MSMNRTNADGYELSDAEKRDLIKLINEGKPLPEKYRFLLFQDKREVELVWNGKTREVCTAVLPFQTLEHIDEPREEVGDEQARLFDIRGRQLKGWTNKLIWGDNKLILSSLKSGALRQQIEDAGGLKLIYIDPPFDVGADFSMDIEIGGETFHKEPNLLEQIAYRDTWGRGADSFIAMIYERLVLMRDLMAEDASIYVHCDWRVTAFIRLVLGDVFGEQFFRNEIIWKRTSAHSSAKRFGPVHDTILFYAKTDTQTWNEVIQPYDEAYVDQRFARSDPDGRSWKDADLTGSGTRQGDTGTPWRGFDPTAKGRHWAYPPTELDAMDAKGLVYWPAKEGGWPRQKHYRTSADGIPVQDVITDIFPVNAMAQERRDYPTQKSRGQANCVLLARTAWYSKQSRPAFRPSSLRSVLAKRQPPPRSSGSLPRSRTSMRRWQGRSQKPSSAPCQRLRTSRLNRTHYGRIARRHGANVRSSMARSKLRTQHSLRSLTTAAG